MRKISEITATIVPFNSGVRSYDRRPLRSFAGQVTCLMLFKHDETETQVRVSDDGDAVGAVWIAKALLAIDPKDRGPFLVVTLSHAVASRNRLQVCLLDWDRYTPDECLMLKDAVECAKRRRQRLGGQSSNRPTWHGGRNVYA